MTSPVCAGSLPAGNVPEDILAALVVSVVAEVASPEISLEDKVTAPTLPATETTSDEPPCTLSQAAPSEIIKSPNVQAENPSIVVVPATLTL